MIGVAVESGVGVVSVGVSNFLAGEDVAITMGETVNSVGRVEIWAESAAGSVGAGVGSGRVAFHWMAKMINPIMPTAMISVHKFDFKVAPRFCNIVV